MEPPAVIGAETIVRIWEQGRYQHPVDRAVTILAALTQRPRNELTEISVERRDAMLLAWRSRLFGEVLAGYAGCPACGCGIDVSLTAPARRDPDERIVVEVGGSRYAARLPTSLDLLAVAGCPTVDEARAMLVRLCLTAPDLPGDDIADRDEVIAAVEAELDRHADVSAGTVSLACPDCEHSWTVELDVAAFAWREIEVLAVRLLRQVDVLARRYGWSEQEILGLTPARRRFYLELAS